MTIGRPRNIHDNDILDAYDRTLHRVGPTKLTLALVAREAGVVPATLIQRMGSKRNLVARATERGADRMLEVFNEARQASQSPVDVIENVIRRLLSGVNSREAMANSIAALHSEIVDPLQRQGVVRQTRTIQEQFALLIAQVVEEAEAERLGRMVYVAYSGALVTWAIDGKGDIADWTVAAIRDVLAGSM